LTTGRATPGPQSPPTSDGPRPPSISRALSLCPDSVRVISRNLPSLTCQPDTGQTRGYLSPARTCAQSPLLAEDQARIQPCSEPKRRAACCALQTVSAPGCLFLTFVTIGAGMLDCAAEAAVQVDVRNGNMWAHAHKPPETGRHGPTDCHHLTRLAVHA